MRTCVRWAAVIVLVAGFAGLARAHGAVAPDSPALTCDGSKWSPFGDVSYDSATRVLWICFACGCEYTYRDVPPRCFRAFAQSPEKGAFFNQCIRPCFSARRLSPEQQASKRKGERPSRPAATI